VLGTGDGEGRGRGEGREDDDVAMSIFGTFRAPQSPKSKKSGVLGLSGPFLHRF